MFKKSVLMALALGFVFCGSLYAQDAPLFSITPPGGKIEPLSPDLANGLKDATDLSQTEVESLIAQNQCGNNVRFPTFCVGWSGPFCTGVGTVNPCGFFTNGVFGSVSTGCTRTVVSPNLNLVGGTLFTGFPDNTCITPTVGILRSFACVTP
jgi:hypothetical protein